MLNEIDLSKKEFDYNNAGERTVAEMIDALITSGKKVIAKERIISTGKYINVYVYDKRLYRYVIFSSVQVG